MSWTGNSLKLVLLFFAMVVCPPIWIFFSLPLNIKMNKVPYVKFICRTVSHFFFLLLLVLTGTFLIDIDIWPFLTSYICSSMYSYWWYSKQDSLHTSVVWVVASKYVNIQSNGYYDIDILISVWVSGLLLTELTTVGERTGVGMLK